MNPLFALLFLFAATVFAQGQNVKGAYESVVSRGFRTFVEGRGPVGYSFSGRPHGAVREKF